MKRATFALLSLTLAWVMGCATPQLDPEDGLANAAAQPEEPAPDEPDPEPGATLRMRAPAPTAALRPQPTPATESGGDVESGDARPAPVVEEIAPVVGAYRLKEGDPIIATFRGIPAPFTVEDIIDERGMIALPYVGDVRAVGRTSSELEKLIFELYVPNYYRYMNVNVLMPSQRSYYVQGAVRGPGKHPYSAGMTLMRAISTAGGYTDFADRKRVKLLRAGKTQQYNMVEIQKNPESDVLLEPADQIIVPEKWY